MENDEVTFQNPVRWLYDWVLSWADTTYGGIVLFLLAFTEATFFPVPPDVLLVALVLGARTKAFRFAAICTVGSVLGALAGFGLGFFFWSSVNTFFFSVVIEEATFSAVQDLYDRNLFLIIVSAAFSPIPFKVFTIASGVFAEGLSGLRLARFFLTFFLASCVGRAIRFYVVSYLLYRFGKPVREWLERYFNLVTLLVVLFLLLIVLLTRWM